MTKQPRDSALRAIRKERGLSLEQTAEDLGISHSTLGRIETGVTVPNRKVARALFEYFDGEIELGSIYDPFYASGAEDIDDLVISG